MTHYNISHWTISDGKPGLFLFAQSLEELLATYCHDSHKVPALKFHFVCYETLHAISLIEDNVLNKGMGITIPYLHAISYLTLQSYVLVY